MLTNNRHNIKAFRSTITDIIHNFEEDARVTVEIDQNTPKAIDGVDNPIAGDAAITDWDAETRTATLWVRNPETISTFVIKHELGHIGYQDGGMGLFCPKEHGGGYFSIMIADLLREIHLEVNMVTNEKYTRGEIKNNNSHLTRQWKLAPIKKYTPTRLLHPVFWVQVLGDCALMFATEDLTQVKRIWKKKGLANISKMIQKIGVIVNSYRNEMVGRSFGEFAALWDYSMMFTEVWNIVVRGIGQKNVDLIDEINNHPTVPFSGKTTNHTWKGDPDELKKFISKLPTNVNHKIIPLKKNDKSPNVTGSIKDNIDAIALSKEKAIKYIERGMNVGCYAFKDGLVFIDIDVENNDTKLSPQRVNDLIESLNTFTVKTRNGGFQLYCLNDGTIDNSLIYYTNDDGEEVVIGEIRADWQYVVLAGSYVPPDNDATSDATGLYEVVKDTEIKHITLSDISAHMQIKRKDDRKKHDIDVPLVEPVGGWINDMDMTLAEVRKRDKKLDNLLSGPFPCEYSSRSEADMACASKLWFWRFTENQIAGILLDYRPYEKTERDDYLATTVSKVIGGEQYSPATQHKITLTDRDLVATMPQELPDVDIIMIVKPPRVGHNGGTHYSIEQLIKAGSGNYITHRHQGVEHALDIFKRLNAENKTTAVVWLEGKNRPGMCVWDNDQNCDDCPLKPDEHKKDHIGFFDLDFVVEQLLDKHGVLTKETISDIGPSEINAISRRIGEKVGSLCPYYTLIAAERKAKYCFSVVNFIDRITPRKLLVIDEPQTLHAFYPGSVEIAEFTNNGMESRSKFTLGKEYMPAIRLIREKIKNKKRQTKEEQIILCMIDSLEEFCDIIDISDMGKLIKKEKEAGFLTKRIKTISENFMDVDPHAIIDTLTDYTIPGEHDPISVFKTLLFLYERPISIVRSNNMRNTIFLVGDDSEPRLKVESVLESSQIMLIGGVENEYFARCLSEKYDMSLNVFEITEFPYKDNFLVIPVNARGVGRDKEEWEKKIQRRRNLIKIIKKLHKNNVSTILWTGSKQKANTLETKFNKLTYKLRDDNVNDIKRESRTKIMIGNANSKVSRSVDVPFIDVNALCDTNFASPYWHAVAHNDAADRETRQLAEYMQLEIVCEETTNMALRISPTYEDNVLQPKIVLCPHDEVWKLRWIDDRIIDNGGRDGNRGASSIVDLIKEVVGIENYDMEVSLETLFGEVLANEVLERFKGTREVCSYRSTYIIGQSQPRGGSIWSECVRDGTLLQSVSIKLSNGELEMSKPMFDIMKKNLLFVFDNAGGRRMAQTNLMRRLKALSITSDENVIKEFMIQLVRVGVLRKEKDGKKWMYSLIGGGG